MASMRYIITKFALTTGVFTCAAKPCNDGTMINAGRAGYFHKPDWHTSTAEAVARVEQMRAASIKSAKKKLARLEALIPADAVALAADA